MSIQRQLLNDYERINVPADLFGDTHYPFMVEPFFFTMAGNLSKDYTGGYWNMYRLSNQGFYMAPDDDTLFQITCMNGYEGTLSPDAFGITVCLYAYSNLSFAVNPDFSEVCAEQFHLLRDYMLEHQEVDKIFRAID